MDLHNKTCLNPFSFIEIHENGNVYFCCPRWADDYSIGNVFDVEKDAIDEIWNSERAQHFRREVISGEFNSCNKTSCARIAANRLPDRDAVFGKDISTVMNKGPRQIKFCHDNSCNLFCYSCRPTKYHATATQNQKLDRFLDIVKPLLTDAEVLNLSGAGDPFASRHYRKIISTAIELSNTKFSFHTNGVLFDERAWDQLNLQNRVLDVNISIDAATEETYKIVRRGGDFQRLKNNLSFLQHMREIKHINFLAIGFVIQANNFEEMPMFVELGKHYGVDQVYFSVIRDWGSIESFGDAQIWNPQHPKHHKFLSLLSHDSFQDPIVNLGDVTPFASMVEGRK